MIVTTHLRSTENLGTVLRARPGQPLQIFNGRGGCFDGEVITTKKKQLLVEIGQHHETDIESPLSITLLQGISRGQKMDYTLQKSVELGVARIVPVMSQHSNVRLNDKKADRRLDHWRQIIINACEQCGRNKVPEITPVMTLEDCLDRVEADLKVILYPKATSRLSDLDPPAPTLSLMVGPEGGFSDTELVQAEQAGYLPVRLGPRILRTETAAVAALTAVQTLWGDLL